jgi:hypothetical protein
MTGPSGGSALVHGTGMSAGDVFALARKLGFQSRGVSQQDIIQFMNCLGQFGDDVPVPERVRQCAAKFLLPNEG